MKKKLLFSVLLLVLLALTVNAQNFSITIDAEKDAFYDALTGPSNGLVFMPYLCYLRDIGTPPTDDADLSAKVWFAYDADYLYCYAEVKDDIVAATNTERFQNDCMELKFDPDPNSGTNTKTANCRITAKGADNAEEPTGVDNLNGSGHLEDVEGTDYVVSESDYARRLTDDGYVLEFRVPFDYINEPEDNRFMVERTVGNKFGMAINIGDNDGTTREHMIQWSAGHTDGAHSYPALCGTATFMDNHVLKLEAVGPRPQDTVVVNPNAGWYIDPNFAVAIDAEKDAFYSELTGPSNGLVFMPYLCYLRDIGTPPTDNADLSAKVWFSYDADYLYCYAEVKDDIVAATNTERFQNDCLELKFDPDPNSGTNTKTSNCRITAKGADNAEEPTGVDNLNGSGHLEDVEGTDYVVSESDYARRLTDDGYVLEFRVPFDYINEPEDNRFMVERTVGNKFGMAINIGDNDGTTREHMIQWSAGHTDGAHSYPALCGTATFMDNHVLKLEAVGPRPQDTVVVNPNAEEWYTKDPTAGIKGQPPVAESFNLLTNYPNPFNPSTTIKFSVPKTAFVTLKIHNTLGQEVARLVAQRLNEGVYTVNWNAAEFPSGIYIVRMVAGDLINTSKMVLLK